MVFSPQQIKFEFLSYLKEFGARPEEWRIGVADDAERALFADNEVDRAHDIWLWKPALSAAAARIVLSYFAERHGIAPARYQAGAAARHVFLFKRQGSAGRAAAG
jgi:hypothetical protein